ncbi:hypothetical protein [Staphylococcus epidermidis]|uniref:hypothetical protein n=1 Tax=Staphylococcus epidermidis TaxID=1282 RepID=UPI000986CF9B|nr:hypothetical protein [Staphylococcus epidermidis]OOC95052.1 hypothetical protein BWO96_13070 [Staphylococcus epidermidis]
MFYLHSFLYILFRSIYKLTINFFSMDISLTCLKRHRTGMKIAINVSFFIVMIAIVIAYFVLS